MVVARTQPVQIPCTSTNADYPQDLKVLDIGSTWAYLSWKELFVFCGPSPPTYEITCDSREKAFKFTTMETSYNITDLSTNIIYNCTVFAISDNQRCSLNSPPTQFLPGITINI